MKNIPSKIITTLLLTGCIFGLQAQVTNSFYDRYKEKTFYMDSIRMDDLEELAANHYMWDNWETSTTIYDYLLSKNFISLDTNDTAHIGSWGHYMNLAHLRLIQHKYTEAKILLVLSEKAEQPRFWCGNAAAAIFNEKDAFDQECKLGVAPLRERDKLLAGLFGMALYQESVEMNTDAGKCAVNYLQQFYTIDKLKELLKKMAGTIQVTRLEEHRIHASVIIFNKPVAYSFYCESCHSGTRTYYLYEVSNWFPYKEEEEE
jgi:hypothetical protein